MCFVSASCLPILLLLYSVTFYTQSASFLRLTTLSQNCRLCLPSEQPITAFKVARQISRNLCSEARETKIKSLEVGRWNLKHL